MFSFEKSILTVIAVVAVIAACARPVRADGCLDSSRTDNIRHLQYALCNDDFTIADSLTRKMIEQHPEDPSGYLFRAVLLITEMFDCEENMHQQQFHRLIDSALAKAVSVRDASSGRECAWMSLLIGHCHAYRSLWQSHFGSLLAAIRTGRRAKAEYERGLACDSSLYDLYFGLGLYHYWKSAKAGLLRFLHIIHNDKDKGIRQLRLAADSSLVSKEPARNALIWIWLDSKQYDSVIYHCRLMRQRYPHGKAFLWPLARAHYRKKEYRLALQTFQQLRELIASEPGNYYNLVECDYFRYRCCRGLSAGAETDRVLADWRQYSDKIPKDTRRRQRAKVISMNRVAGN